MALSDVVIQGANSVLSTVVIDTITGETYGIPIYKIGLGVVGTDDGPVSATNPMPVTLGDSFERAGVTHTPVVDNAVFEVLEKILTTLQKLERHAFEITDEEFDEGEFT